MIEKHESYFIVTKYNLSPWEHDHIIKTWFEVGDYGRVIGTWSEIEKHGHVIKIWSEIGKHDCAIKAWFKIMEHGHDSISSGYDISIWILRCDIMRITSSSDLLWTIRMLWMLVIW